MSFGADMTAKAPTSVPKPKPAFSTLSSTVPVTSSFGGGGFGSASVTTTPVSTGFPGSSVGFGGFGASTAPTGFGGSFMTVAKPTPAIPTPAFSFGTPASTGLSFADTTPSGGFPSPSAFGGPAAAYSAITSSPTKAAEPADTGFYALDNNAVRRQLEEARKGGKAKRKLSDDSSGFFGPQPGSFGSTGVGGFGFETPTKQHTFDAGGITPPQSPSLLAFSTFGHPEPITTPAVPSFALPQPATQPSQPTLSPPSFGQPAFSQPVSSSPLFSQPPAAALPSFAGQAQPTVIRVAGPLPTPATSTTKLLLLIALLSKKGLISGDEKGVLKDLTLSKNELVLSALEVFEIDQDLNELADTLRRVCKHHTA